MEAFHEGKRYQKAMVFDKRKKIWNTWFLIKPHTFMKKYNEGDEKKANKGKPRAGMGEVDGLPTTVKLLFWKKAKFLY